MRKLTVFIIVSISLFSCVKNNFIQQIQGTWKVVEVNYLYDQHTQTYFPANQQFIFDDENYEHWMDGELKESGSFVVNPKATQIKFTSNQGGNYTYTIVEKNENTQRWKSKNKLIDFYLDFKLEKLY